MKISIEYSIEIIVMADRQETKFFLNFVYKIAPFGTVCMWEIETPSYMGIFQTTDFKKHSHLLKAPRVMADNHLLEMIECPPEIVFFAQDGNEMVMGPPQIFEMKDDELNLYDSTFDDELYAEQFHQQTVAEFYRYTLLKPTVYITSYSDGLLFDGFVDPIT